MKKELRRTLMLLTGFFVVAISFFSLGIAYTGGIRGMGLLGIWFFIIFGIIIVLAQLIPAGILLSSFLGTNFLSMSQCEMPVEIT